MSRRTHTHPSRSLAVAGLLMAASVAVSNIGVAQSVGPEHALMNRYSVTTRNPSAPRAVLSAPSEPAVAYSVTGERVLLNRVPAAAWSTRFGWGGAPAVARELVIDGEAALLGKRE